MLSCREPPLPPSSSPLPYLPAELNRDGSPLQMRNQSRLLHVWREMSRGEGEEKEREGREQLRREREEAGGGGKKGGDEI